MASQASAICPGEEEMFPTWVFFLLVTQRPLLPKASMPPHKKFSEYSMLMWPRGAGNHSIFLLGPLPSLTDS